ncbi:helix-turn-helix domain-containing protein [Arthrobacter sp. 35W]|uniref:helix-turn-helix domain-containing protein n=1 Tax=Arthrobacter sp. 35W TaxID=1132441 RepID=UPI0018CBB516|nr:AraC family transcriptional regulator [Arthrobacter sp. 35W]
MAVADHVVETPVRAYGDEFRRRGAHSSAAELWTAPAAWDMVPAQPDGYQATATTWYCDWLMITHCRGDASSLFRREHHLGDPFDAFVHLVLVHAGGIIAVQGGAEFRAGPGDVATVLPRAPYAVHNLDGTDATLLHIPVGYLEYRGIDTDQLQGAAFSGGPMVDAVRALVSSTLDLPEHEGARHAPFIERAVLELATGLLGGFQSGFALDDDAAQTSRDRVLDLVEGGFADPAFSVDTVARRLGASRRYVYRLFEGRRLSVASLIKTRRMDEAVALLRTGSADLSLARIARLSGFSTPAAMSRAFKELAGITPSQYRLGRASAPTAPPSFQ